MGIAYKRYLDASTIDLLNAEKFETRLRVLLYPENTRILIQLGDK